MGEKKGRRKYNQALTVGKKLSAGEWGDAAPEQAHPGMLMELNSL